MNAGNVMLLVGLLILNTFGAASSANEASTTNCVYYGENKVRIADEGNRHPTETGLIYGTCKDLGCTDVNFAENVTTIGKSAFESCSTLASINIPSEVTTIGDWAFSGCRNLASVDILPNSKLITIGDTAFRECSSLASINIPSDVTTIGNWAFEECSSLASITIPSDVTTIGDKAFHKCINLASVDILPNSKLTTIGKSAFEECSSLASINIPSNVTVAPNAFKGTPIKSWSRLGPSFFQELPADSHNVVPLSQCGEEPKDRIDHVTFEELIEGMTVFAYPAGGNKLNCYSIETTQKMMVPLDSDGNMGFKDPLTTKFYSSEDMLSAYKKRIIHDPESASFHQQIMVDQKNKETETKDENEDNKKPIFRV